ncbi:hypothetical protein IEQ34_004884 [Dendrobium chrysotoxum]|uniref:RING-type E3 ubiquitin transferase n=1 Tax=Dendrobium chrysotoxum TaxID=161865 RepID=A0AAV7H850_DENCH|nr:hypothetical protein IEQ34_004884 [Dendrobium chrysotoxum]
MEDSSLFYNFIIGALAAFTIATIYFCIISILRHRRMLADAGQTPGIDDIENQRIIFEFQNGKGDGFAGGKGDRMCAVCLSKFDDGEDIKLLPECKHCFHVQCIDMWLQSHSSCPLCRTKTKTVTEKNKEKVKGASPAGNCGEKGGGWTASWFWWAVAEDSVIWI